MVYEINEQNRAGVKGEGIAIDHGVLQSFRAKDLKRCTFAF
jgi:hypothetical protein